jgi:hypothetical protein
MIVGVARFVLQVLAIVIGLPIFALMYFAAYWGDRLLGR